MKKSRLPPGFLNKILKIILPRTNRTSANN